MKKKRGRVRGELRYGKGGEMRVRGCKCFLSLSGEVHRRRRHFGAGPIPGSVGPPIFSESMFSLVSYYFTRATSLQYFTCMITLISGGNTVSLSTEKQSLFCDAV